MRVSHAICFFFPMNKHFHPLTLFTSELHIFTGLFASVSEGVMGKATS